MPLLVERKTLETLSTTGRMLAREPTDLINDVVRIVKMSEIRLWALVHVFFELRRALTKLTLSDGSVGITNITISGDAELPLLNFYHSQGQVFSLTINDLQRLSLAKPSSE